MHANESCMDSIGKRVSNADDTIEYKLILKDMSYT